ncbi:MAG: hypothetical protein A2W61_06150 [Deltaproteobacteria bacterium RIFCSPLOWO2_01_44_7]|nr:MAG: hypothetical protein A2712_02040 [Deltaproteobacteria bacterium RIFCSPHIGHO2_01_FULL_43_49]OGQ15094.1 MAG: hypothetical protein A3D22_03440 [Deltaproteobacteria bacterium RIFCSPHIGHO2_02_FULL_44_53]OGQ27286.1 MAG: hypothetical protein A3D98_02635 [Deltaproteobacteria bacterium RIFCSPHIGHO2_12_FULL_44_21]OGQ31611.1 MAG: hypothetical protein A2979_04600 [Deltaproteobacteria bacterium RIFCSPLOWO2_01_FULL_45_74]OGQ42717.1 MAG: hypothetical protein A2W61_06150 [Deltaproteobacteria bacterium 
MRNSALVLSFLFFVVSTSDLLAQSGDSLCTQETMEDCYSQAKTFYSKEDYESAKILFQKVIELNANYKQADVYLKKCYSNMAKTAIKQESQAQRDKEKEEKERLKEEKVKQREAKKLAAKEKKEAPVEEETVYPPAQEEYPAMAEETPLAKPQPYRVGVGDVLEISVWRNVDLDKIVIVRPDGSISYPFVGEISAAGLTLMEIDERLTSSLSNFIRNPQVSVAIQKFAGMKVILLGEVKSPGVYSPPGGSNIIDLIALAGGFTNDAVKKGTILIRGGLQQPEIYRLNLARILKGDLSQNIALASSDIVYVPRLFIANLNIAISRITPLLSNTLLGTSVYRDVKDLVR